MQAVQAELSADPDITSGAGSNRPDIFIEKQILAVESLKPAAAEDKKPRPPGTNPYSSFLILMKRQYPAFADLRADIR
jgi:hypothetical protein